MGIDPREGTLLTLFMAKLAQGVPGETALREVEFKSNEIRDVARALTGETNVSSDARAEADQLRSWAGLPPASAR